METPDPDGYYKSHWAEIEPERMARYDELFRMTDEIADKMLARVGVQPGETILDFGCGPGYVASQLARLSGPGGRVHGLDVNPEFLERARQVAEEAGRGEQITFHHSTDETIPLEDGSVDRVYVKNVLEYVPDPDRVLGEIRRVLRPGGEAVVSDSDFGFVVIEPLEPEEITELFDAARPAFNEPLIGRRLRGAMRRAGFDDVRVDVVAAVDTRGLFRGVVENMLGYGRSFGRISEARADELAAKVDEALADGSYQAVLPQWWVRGTA